MAVSGISSIGGSSIGSLMFQALAASGAFSVSQVTQDRLAALQTRESAVATRLSDLSTLRGLLADLSSAAAALRPSSTTLGSNIDVDHIDGDAADEWLELELADATDLKTGDKIRFTSSDGGVTAGTTYFVNVVQTDANSKDIRLYTTRSAALAGGTANAVDLTTSLNSTLVGNQVIPQPKEGIEALFNAYNELQEFLAEKTKEGGPLADERVFRTLGSKLLDSLRPALESSEFSPAVSFNGSSREITIDSDVLTTQIASHTQTIASLFDDTGENIADDLRNIADTYISAVDTRAATLNQQSPELTAQITNLLQKSQQEQAEGFNLIGQIAGTISLAQYRIQFLSALAG